MNEAVNHEEWKLRRAACERFQIAVAAELYGWTGLHVCDRWGGVRGHPPVPKAEAEEIRVNCLCGDPLPGPPDPDNSAEDDYEVLDHVRRHFTPDQLLRFGAVLAENWEFAPAYDAHPYTPGDYARAALAVLRPRPPRNQDA